jgi:hypothetical protein
MAGGGGDGELREEIGVGRMRHWEDAGAWDVKHVCKVSGRNGTELEERKR